MSMGRAHGSAQTLKTAPYEKGMVSLPSAGRSPVNIVDHLPETPRRFLASFDEFLLQDDAHLAEVHDYAGTIVPYMDGALRSRPAYEGFISELHQAGIVSWTRSAKGRCTPFFVKKKNGRLRLVLDLRQVNAFFKPAAGCEMGSLAAICELELEDSDQKMYVSQADVQDCFWQCAVPRELSRWFCMDCISGSYLLSIGVTEVDGLPVSASDRIHPMCSCLPMGWNWALHLCQSFTRDVVSCVCPDSSFFSDYSRFRKLDSQ